MENTLLENTLIKESVSNNIIRKVKPRWHFDASKGIKGNVLHPVIINIDKIFANNNKKIIILIVLTIY